MPRAEGGTRSALLDSALDAFSSRGYAGASIREITRAVGVRESAFYAHFPSKRAIYDELFEEAGPPAVGRAFGTLGWDVSPEAFLRRFATFVIDSWSTRRARKFGAMLMRDALDSEAQGWRSLRAAIDAALTLLTERFERWQKNGEVRTNVAAPTLAFEFITPIVMIRFLFFNIAAGRAEARRGHVVLEEHVTTFLRLLDSGSPEKKPR